MQIDINGLKNIEREKRKSKAFYDSLILSSFISIIDNIIVIGSNMNKTEMAMFINSIQHWIFERGKKRNLKNVHLELLSN